MTQAPQTPKDQTSHADKGGKPKSDATHIDRRDLETEIRTGQPGDSDVNLDTQGRFGNIKQNVPVR